MFLCSVKKRGDGRVGKEGRMEARKQGECVSGAPQTRHNDNSLSSVRVFEVEVGGGGSWWRGASSEVGEGGRDICFCFRRRSATAAPAAAPAAAKDRGGGGLREAEEDEPSAKPLWRGRGLRCQRREEVLARFWEGQKQGASKKKKERKKEKSSPTCRGRKRNVGWVGLCTGRGAAAREREYV